MLCGLIKHVLTSQSRCSRVLLVCRLLIGFHHLCSQRIETLTQFLVTEINPGTATLIMEVIGRPNQTIACSVRLFLVLLCVQR